MYGAKSWVVCLSIENISGWNDASFLLKIVLVLFIQLNI